MVRRRKGGDGVEWRGRERSGMGRCMRGKRGDREMGQGGGGHCMLISVGCKIMNWLSWEFDCCSPMYRASTMADTHQDSQGAGENLTLRVRRWRGGEARERVCLQQGIF